MKVFPPLDHPNSACALVAMLRRVRLHHCIVFNVSFGDAVHTSVDHDGCFIDLRRWIDLMRSVSRRSRSNRR
jgi:hypothetical protein